MTAMFLIALFPLAVLLTQYFGDVDRFGTGRYAGRGHDFHRRTAHQAWSANLFTTVSDMFPKKAVASVTGIGTTAGGIGGVMIQLLRPAERRFQPNPANRLSHHVHRLRLELSDCVGHHESARAAAQTDHGSVNGIHS